MGRLRKGKKLVRSGLLEMVGGMDIVVKKLCEADVLNRNTNSSSEIWSKLAIDLFNKDILKNRVWIWKLWTKNKGLRDRVDHLSAGAGSEGEQSGRKDMEAQSDTKIVKSDFKSQPQFQERGTDLEEETNEGEPEEGGTNEQEPGARQCPRVKKIFFISVSRENWDEISPQGGSLKLRSPWTDHVYSCFKEKNPFCTLSFKYQHIKSPNSRKRFLPYLQLKAVCKFSTCPAQYSFTMKSDPATLGQDVQMLVRRTGDIKHLKHNLEEKKARPATYQKRGRISKALMNGPSQLDYDKLQATATEELLAGNKNKGLRDRVDHLSAGAGSEGEQSGRKDMEAQSDTKIVKSDFKSQPQFQEQGTDLEEETNEGEPEEEETNEGEPEEEETNEGEPEEEETNEGEATEDEPKEQETNKGEPEEEETNEGEPEEGGANEDEPEDEETNESEPEEEETNEDEPEDEETNEGEPEEEETNEGEPEEGGANEDEPEDEETNESEPEEEETNEDEPEDEETNEGEAMEDEPKEQETNEGKPEEEETNEGEQEEEETNEGEPEEEETNEGEPEEEETNEGEPEEGGTNEQEPGARQCPRVKKIFYISVSRENWDEISPQGGSLKLRSPWTDHVYSCFKEKNPFCTLSFKYQHIKSPKSRKRLLPYLQLKAVCKFSTCPAQYSFTMKSDPATLGQDVQMLVRRTGDIKHLKHNLEEKKARPATYQKRGRISKALTNGPSQLDYDKLQATPTEELLAGNMSKCLSKTVLKAIDLEMKRKESLHSDIQKEIYLIQMILKECDTKYFKIPGYIQLFSMNPFLVHMYTERGISILVHHLRSNSPVALYLDATGGVIPRIPDQQKKVLYYTLALPGKGKDVPPLPVCELLSNEHSVSPISFWLMQFRLQLLTYSQINIHQIETDYSWALIQSVMLAFNKESINSYLNRAFEFCMGKKTVDDMKPYTILHICAAHVLKAVRQGICKQTEDKGLRDFATYAFARLQNATNMTESRIVFHALCILLTSPQNTSLVQASLDILETVILRAVDDPQEETPDFEDWEICESEDRRNATTLTANSPFSAFFKQIREEVKGQLATEEPWSAKEDNAYYCPGILKILFDTYLAIFPLWSGLLLGNLSRHKSQEEDFVIRSTLRKTRDTNCHIEGWFCIVKHSIMRNEKKAKPGTFIRKMHQSMQARYTEHIIQHNLPQKLLLQNEPPLDLDRSVETWMKKGKHSPSSSKSKYYSSPQKVPFPQRKRLVMDATPSKGSSGTDDQPPVKRLHIVDKHWNQDWTAYLSHGDMERFGMGKRSCLLEKVGGMDIVVKKLCEADVLNRNTNFSSEIWSKLAIDLFNKDIKKNREWIWRLWTKNKGLRDRVDHLSAGAGSEGEQSGRKDMTTQCDVTIVKSEGEFVSQLQSQDPVTDLEEGANEGEPQEGGANERKPEEEETNEREPEEEETNEGEPQEGGANEGEPEDGGTNEGEPEEGGASEGEPEEGGANEGEPQEGGANEGEPQEGGANEGEPQEGGANEREPEEEATNEREPEEEETNEREPEEEETNEREPEEEETNEGEPKGRANEQEPGASVWRQCPEVKKQFFISMSKKNWDKISPQGGSLKLRSPWTDHVYRCFKEKNPCCTLSFKYQHIKSPKSRKRFLPYLQLKAVCTFSTCPAQYSFTMKSDPATLDQDVQMLVRRTGDIKHKLLEKKARPATNQRRKRISKALTNGPSNYYYDKLQATPTEELLAGNMSKCLSKTVLKAIGSETRRKESIHSDILKEIYLMQTILKECDINYFKIPGYIQLFSMNPFLVHMYTERGISILVHHLRSNSPVALYLDATGGVVSRIPDQQKKVLYYTLALPGKGKDVPPLPVSELLSNEHSVPPIAFWLMQFQLQLLTYSQINIHQIETDYSWALIQSVMLAFNKESINSYLNRAFEFCMGKKTVDDMKPYTILHICAAHVLKAVRQGICKQTEDKGLRDFATYAFARLQNATNMTESRIVFHALCILLTSPQNTSLVQASLDILETVILRAVDDPQEETPDFEDWEICESEDRRNATTLTGNSPFSAFFKQIREEVKGQLATEEPWSAKEDNAYYCPGILKILFDTYLAIFPLWSGLLLGNLSRHKSQEEDFVIRSTLRKTRDTNCHIEGWFCIVKHSIMRNKKKAKPGTFIRKMHQSMQARYTEHIIQHNLPQKLLLQNEPPLDLDRSVETWMKKGKHAPSSSNSKYNSSPQKVPFPQRKRLVMDATPSKGSSGTDDQPPVKRLHVVDKVTML